MLQKHLNIGRRFYNTTFYNRAAEVARLTTRFKGDPALTVLLGPPSSGKTALVKHVVEQKYNDGSPLFHPLQIDLRGKQPASPDALYRALYNSSWNFFKEAKFECKVHILD